MTAISAISQQIWDMKYRFRDPDGTVHDKTVEDTWRRVARALAEPETNPAEWEEKFYDALEDFKFLPAGRIIAGAGTARSVTLFNCFVMGTIPDDMAGIFTHLKEAALTMQQGGGIGYDFSTLRPKGALVKGVGADASGPLSFMDVWDSMCRTIMSAGSRRGAMMATMRCDHPDIEEFIEAKQEAGRLRMFNLSVLVTDAFMEAVAKDDAWELVFDNQTYRTVRARTLWDRIMRATYAAAEPGVIFIDRINRLNNLHYAETISATNPCGEQPLPPYGACLLGSINLARLVVDPFTDDARLDEDALAALVPLAVRMMDNVVEVSEFPLEEQAAEARAKRRIGLGITGLGDALILCGVRYGSDRAVALAERWAGLVERHAIMASTALAAEKGAFPLYDRDKYLAGKHIAALDQDLRDAIAENGIRNALLTSIAPTGTISLFADNISSGIEPVFAFSFTRNVLMPDGTRQPEEVSDYAFRLWKQLHGEDAPLPGYFVDAQSLTPNDHLVMQAAVQKHVDSSISKTINCPESLSFEDFREIYLEAYKMGCKGCTTYRPNAITGAVLEAPGSTAAESGAAESAEIQTELPLEAPTRKARPADEFDSGAVVYMTQPLDRPEELPGHTYKIKWADTEHAIYITLNDIIQDGRRRPFEIFINTKSTEHHAWTVALTRMISAVFRRGGDVSFVVEELKAVFDPRGGQWFEGRYVPSLLAAIGGVIERHMIDTGFLPRPGDLPGEPANAPAGESTPKPTPLAVNQSAGDTAPAPAAMPRPDQCPKCGEAALIQQEGCDLCTGCGYSKCG